MTESTDRAPALPAPRSAAEEQRAPTYHGFVSVQGRGTVAIPAELRKRYGLDRPGAQFEISERTDGVLEFRPMAAVPASEAWYWTPDFQAGERQVEDDLAAGRVEHFGSSEEFLTWLQEQDDVASERANGLNR